MGMNSIHCRNARSFSSSLKRTLYMLKKQEVLFSSFMDSSFLGSQSLEKRFF